MTLTYDILPWLLAGVAMGSVYLLLIRYSVAAIVDGRRFGAAPHLVLRIALAAAIFFLAAQQGALPAILVLCGFLLVRMVVLGRVRRG
jgi:hypothetical protein